MMPHILYISYDGLTSQIGQSQVLPYILELSRNGHRICVVSFEARGDFKRLRATVSDELTMSGIEWHPRRFRSRPPLVAKIIDHLDALWTALRLTRHHRFEIVHCRSYFAADIGLKLKRIFGSRMLFDMRGFWVDQRREGGRWPQEKLLFRFLYRRWKAKEAEFIAHSDEIVVLTEAAKDEIETWTAYNGQPISVIPCSLKYERFPISNQNETLSARRQLKIEPNSLVLAYLGSLGTVYLFHEMIVLYQSLKRIQKKSILLMIGRHNQQDIIQSAQEIAPELNLNDFRFVKAEHSEVPFWLGAANIGVCFITSSFSSLGVSPTKLGEYLAAGLPVISNDGIGDVRSIIDDSDAGHVLIDFSPHSIEVAIKQIVRLAGYSREALRERSRPFHDMERAVGLYDQIYRRLA